MGLNQGCKGDIRWFPIKIHVGLCLPSAMRGCIVVVEEDALLQLSRVFFQDLPLFAADLGVTTYGLTKQKACLPPNSPPELCVQNPWRCWVCLLLIHGYSYILFNHVSNTINVFLTNQRSWPATAGLIFNSISSTYELIYPFIGCWFVWSIVTINLLQNVNDILPTKFHHKFNVCPGLDFGGFHVAWMAPDFQLAVMHYYLQGRVHVWTSYNLLVQECSGTLKPKSFNIISSYGLFPQTFWRSLK